MRGKPVARPQLGWNDSRSQRGILYVPTGSAAFDSTAPIALAIISFANCLIALNASTGERIWHFQGVHHDLWDREFPFSARAPHGKARRKGNRCGGANYKTRFRLSFRSHPMESLFSASKPTKFRRAPFPVKLLLWHSLPRACAFRASELTKTF